MPCARSCSPTTAAIATAALPHTHRPLTAAVLVPPRALQRRPRAVDQQRAQIAVAALADAEQLRSTSRRVLPRHQTQPRRHLPTVAELRRVAHRRHQRCRRLLSHPRDRHQALARLQPSRRRLQLPKHLHPRVQVPQLVSSRSSVRPSTEPRPPGPPARAEQRASPLRRRNAVLQQKAMQLVALRGEMLRATAAPGARCTPVPPTSPPRSASTPTPPRSRPQRSFLFDFTYGLTNCGLISSASCPGHSACRAQWCAPPQLSIATTPAGSRLRCAQQAASPPGGSSVVRSVVSLAPSFWHEACRMTPFH